MSSLVSWMTCLILFRSSGSCTTPFSITGYSRMRVDAAHRHQLRLARIHMQPLRKQHVDLVHVLLERRVAGGIVGNVIRRPANPRLCSAECPMAGGCSCAAKAAAPRVGSSVAACGRSPPGNCAGGRAAEVPVSCWPRNVLKMNPATTSVVTTATASRTRRSRFHRLRWGSEKYLLVGHRLTCAKTSDGSTLYSTNRMEAGSLSQSKVSADLHMQTPALVSAAVALAAGLVLRLWMLHKFFEVNGDSQLYGAMAKNILLHGRYAVNDQTGASTKRSSASPAIRSSSPPASASSAWKTTLRRAACRWRRSWSAASSSPCWPGASLPAVGAWPPPRPRCGSPASAPLPPSTAPSRSPKSSPCSRSLSRSGPSLASRTRPAGVPHSPSPSP